MSGPITMAAKHLMAAGVTGSALIEALAEIEAAMPPIQPQRTARQDRNRRYYEKHKASEKRLRKTVSDVSDAPLKQKVSPTPLSKTQLPSPLSVPKGTYSPRSELSLVLDEERTQAVIDHRQRIRKPLTAHAAKLLAGKFGRCGDPNAAADAMVANGWQGFEPEWLENRVLPRQGSPPNGASAYPPPGNPFARLYRQKLKEYRKEQENGLATHPIDEPAEPYLDLEVDPDRAADDANPRRVAEPDRGRED